MHLHVYEFVTGGGLSGQALPSGLMREGLLMRDALLADLAECATVQVSISHDPRCPAPRPTPRLQVCLPQAGETPQAQFGRQIGAAERVWVIAPETDGVLERIAAAACAAGKAVVGAQPAAIAATASKSRTARSLAAQGVPVVPTFDAAQLDRYPDGGAAGAPAAWVVKPDDGAGCVDTVVVDTLAAARAALRERGAGHVAQPWIDGESLSLSVLAQRGAVELLSVNRQRIAIASGVLDLAAIEVNALPRSAPLATLAARVARAFPGLEGYFGVDLVQAGAGPVVLEVNPRLTTSYAALRGARALNVAARVLGVERGAGPGAHPAPAVDRPIVIALGGTDAQRRDAAAAR